MSRLRRCGEIRAPHTLCLLNSTPPLSKVTHTSTLDWHFTYSFTGRRELAVSASFTRRNLADTIKLTSITAATFPTGSVEAHSLKLPTCRTSRSCESPANFTRFRTALTSPSQSPGAMSTYVMFELSSLAHQIHHTSLASSSSRSSLVENIQERRRACWQLPPMAEGHASTRTSMPPAKCACRS